MKLWVDSFNSIFSIFYYLFLAIFFFKIYVCNAISADDIGNKLKIKNRNRKWNKFVNLKW